MREVEPNRAATRPESILCKGFVIFATVRAERALDGRGDLGHERRFALRSGGHLVQGPLDFGLPRQGMDQLMQADGDFQRR